MRARARLRSGLMTALLLAACGSSSPAHVDSPDGPAGGSGGSSQDAGASAPDVPPAPPSANHLVKVQIVGGGSVQSNPFGIACPAICNGTFATAKAVTLSATSFADWRFQGWSGACSGTGPCTVSVEADATVTASFERVAAGECAGLTPIDPGIPRIVSVPFDSTTPAGCLAGAVDGTGTLAVGSRVFDARTTGHVVFFAPDGSARSTHEYPGLLSLNPDQSGGFSAVAAESTQYGAYSLASDGSVLGHLAGVIPALGTG